MCLVISQAKDLQSEEIKERELPINSEDTKHRNIIHFALQQVFQEMYCDKIMKVLDVKESFIIISQGSTEQRMKDEPRESEDREREGVQDM